MTSLDRSRIRSLTELLCARAEKHPDTVALRFFERGEKESHRLTYGDLDTGARALAATLKDRVAPGDRVLLMFPPGLDFVTSFCASLYLGAIAVPAYPPEMHRLEHAIRRLQAVIDDAKPKVVLTTPEILAMAGPLASALPAAKRLFEIPWVSSTHEPSAASAWAMPSIDDATLAFFQYTSGSTGNPKGAMLSHGNLLADLGMLGACFGEGDRPMDSLCWVPLYHDLGLIGHVLLTFFTGGTCNVMSPIDFLKKPIRWLRLLTETKARLSGAPNFGFDLCVRKITPSEVETLDLRHVDHIANCAEPVRARTLDRFHELFAPAGLRRSAFTPCYGLAEATVMVTCTAPDARPTVLHVDKDALEQHRVAPVAADAEGAVALVGCGRPWNDCEIAIVSPSSLERAEAGMVGEIWAVGSNIAAGYWGREDATQATFGGKLGGDERAYLRTGDLGFVHEGELYVTGRIKDLVIVRGRNLYPQDVERTVDELRAEIPEIRVGCSAAFAWTVEDREELVVLQEVSAEPGDDFDPKLCASEIRRVIFEGFEVQPYEVVLLRSGSIPKTSSGKIMRSACREAYANGFASVIVDPIHRERSAAPSQPRTPAAPIVESAPVSIMSPQSSWKPDVVVAPASHAAPSPLSRKHADEMLEWLRDWAPSRFDPRLADTRRSIAPHVLLDLGNAGVLGMRVPARWGGAGLSALDATRIYQQLSAFDITLASIVGVNNALGIHPIVGFARPALRDTLLPDLAAGRKLAAFALTERGAGSNPLALEARALGGASGPWILNGEKVWIGLGSWASVVTVFVKHEGTEGVSAFAIPEGRAGLRVGPEAMTMGVRSMVQSSILLDRIDVTERDLLGSVGHGFDVAVSTMTEGRLAIGAAAVGGLKRALQIMMRYAERRAIGTGSLFDNPITRERMAEASYGALALDALVTRLASLKDGKGSLPPEAFSAAKVAGSELLWATADHLVQLLGGRGYMEPNDASRLLRDARLLRIFEGPSEALAAHLGGSILRASDRWSTLLSSSLRAPRTAVKLKRAAAELQGALGERPDVPTRRLVAHRAGMALCWALLAAALEGGGGRGGLWAKAGAWLSDRFDEAIREAMGAPSRAKDLLGTNELRDLVNRFAAQIGDVEIPGQGEDTAPDEILLKVRAPVIRPRGPEAAPVSASAPSEPKAATPSLAAAMRDVDMERTLISELSIPDTPRQEAPQGAPKVPDKALEKAPQKAKEPPSDPRQREVESWLVDWVSRTLGVPVENIDVDEPLTTYGVDSLAVVEATSDIEARFGLEVPESAFWSHRTVRALSKHIAAQLPAAKQA
jgi:acyl-CoA synthetase (AMP-forming)/AMP-acid ligase II/alkylation response protein AidB-like acyl-CoA dehydrogenase/acyl carrier protein